MDDLFGIAGLVLILIAWTPGLMETLKSKKPGMKRKFMLAYFLGSVSLSYYSWQLNSLPFMILNGLAALVPAVHFYYSLGKRK